MNAKTLDPLHNIKGLSLRNIFDLGCSTIMQVKYNLSETCDLNAKKPHHLVVPKKQLESSLWSTGISDALQEEPATTIIAAFAPRLPSEDSSHAVSGREHYSNPGRG